MRQFISKTISRQEMDDRWKWFHFEISILTILLAGFHPILEQARRPNGDLVELDILIKIAELDSPRLCEGIWIRFVVKWNPLRLIAITIYECYLKPDHYTPILTTLSYTGSPVLCNFVNSCLYKDPSERMRCDSEEEFIMNVCGEDMVASWLQHYNLC